MSSPKWDRRFLNLAELVASWSKDTSTKVGCVLVSADRVVLGLGYNGLPRGVDDDAPGRDERPVKYLWTEHAERNAVYNGSRTGLGSLIGACAYTNFFPCADCARAFVQVGIRRVVTYAPGPADSRWADHFHVASAMFSEVGIEVAYLPRPGGAT